MIIPRTNPAVQNMFFLDRFYARYVPLVKSNADDNEHYEPSQRPATQTRRIVPIALLAIVCVIVGFVGDELIRGRRHIISGGLGCATLSTRLEWRSLSMEDKEKYLDAVRCLATRPSKKLPQDSLYDDISYVHVDTEEDCTLNDRKIAR